MQVLILMDCMIVVFCLSDRNAPLRAETVEFGRQSRALQYIPQWIRAIVWENLRRAQSIYLFIIMKPPASNGGADTTDWVANPVRQRAETRVALLVVDASGANWLELS